MNNTFGKKTKIIISFICCICIVTATALGVISAKTITNLYFGEEILLDSLDKQSESIGMVNILLMGVDEGGMRSDTMMLVSLNGANNKVNILSVPRDTRVLVGKHYQKINAVIGIGAQEVAKGNLKEPEELSVQKIKLLTGLPIHYFMSVNFKGFEDIIDAFDGVDFEIPFHMKYDDPEQNLHIDLKPGMQHLDGKAAHHFVRFRQGNAGYKGYATGDLGRIEAQQAFIRAFVEQKLNPKYLLRADEIFDIIKANVRTNYTARDLIKHLGTIKNLTADDITMYQLPGTPQTIGGVSYVIADDAKMAELVETVFSPTAEENTTDSSSDKNTSEKD